MNGSGIPVSLLSVWSKYLIIRKSERRKKRENEERKREKKVSEELVQFSQRTNL
jgi:hypothetical protein